MCGVHISCMIEDADKLDLSKPKDEPVRQQPFCLSQPAVQLAGEGSRSQDGDQRTSFLSFSSVHGITAVVGTRPEFLEPSSRGTCYLPRLQVSQVISLQQMAESDDDTSIPTLPTARKPGFDQPIEYVQILDMGGELAKLNSIKDIKVLKAAVDAYKARTIAELCTLIDATGKAGIAERDKIDDMPKGNDQTVAARSLLAKCLMQPNDMIILLATKPASELRRFAVNIGCDSDAIYAALNSPEKSFILAKLIYNSDKFDTYAAAIPPKRLVEEKEKTEDPRAKRQKTGEPPAVIDLVKNPSQLDSFLLEARKTLLEKGGPPNPTPSPALGELATTHTLNSEAAKVAGLTDEQTTQLRIMIDANASATEMSKILAGHVVDTARGESPTIDELAKAAEQPGVQGKFTLTLLGMRPVRPPSGFVGVQPSLKQCFLPDDKKNMLLPCMFNPHPDETESDRLYNASMSLTTDPSSASQSDALISKLLNHSNAEKQKKLRKITSVVQWVNASLNLAQYALMTTPALIPNCVLARYFKYITEYSEEMKANGAETSKQILTLYVKHDELLRFSWGNTLSPENHLYDYQSSPLAMKHLLQPLMQLQHKTARILVSQSNILAASIADDDDDDDDDDDAGGGAGAGRIRKKGTKKGKKGNKKGNKKGITLPAAVTNWPGKTQHAISLYNTGGKAEHLFAADGTTKICCLFNFSCGCSKRSCDDSHHCAFCGMDDHGLRECPVK